MEQLLILACVFFVVSMIFSMLGMGGGILYIPILLFAGYTMKTAPGISLMLISGTSLAALFNFSKNKLVDWKLALVLDPPTDIMAFAGGYFSGIVPDDVLRWLLSGILIIAGVMMIKQQNKTISTTAKTVSCWHWHRQFNDRTYTVNLPLVLSATASIGALSGMLGITGGIIKLPIMVLLCGVPMDVAVATSTVMVAVTALCGLSGHAANGVVDWRTGAVLAVFAVGAGLIGSKISLSVDKRKLKKIFGFGILLIASKIIYDLTYG